MSPDLTITERDIDQPREPEHVADYTISQDWIEQLKAFSCEWLPDVRRQLEAIRRLPPGWDSHASPRPDDRIIEAGWDLVFCLSAAGGVPKPHVNPSPTGGVQFEWEAGDRYFELEVIAERAAVYLYQDEAAGLEEEGEVFEQESLESIVKFIHNVAAIQ